MWNDWNTGDYAGMLAETISLRGYGGDAIRAFMHPGLRNLFLCHLSGNNNTPRLAYDNARAVLEDLGVDPGTVHLRVLERGIPSPLLLL